MHRRTAVIGLGSIATTALGINTLTQDTKALDVSVDSFTVPDKSFDTTTDVSGVEVSIDGKYEYNTSVTPTKVVLRLYVLKNGEETQVAARDWTTDLDSTQTETYTFDNADLLTHPDLSASDFTPGEDVGDSVSQSFTVKVELSVFNDGNQIGTVEATDTNTMTVTRKGATVEGSIGGEATTNVITENPQ